MNNSVTYRVNLEVVGKNIVGEVTSEIQKMTQCTQRATKSFGDCFKSFLAFETAINQFSNLRQSIDELNAPGIALNTSMAELSAITNVTGKSLDAIEVAARKTSKTFGTDASANVESYKLVLSQLDPEIAKNSKAMQLMGDNINILSKQMKGDTVMATNVLTTSMNQFGVSTEDPIQAAKVMADMMNTMSAAAQAGSAELPQIQSALEQVGMVAKTTGLSFEATNAQIQILDKAGKKGSEGGVALRNVLTTLSQGRFSSHFAKEGLEEVGISVEYLANTSISLTDRLRTLRQIQNDTALMTKVFGKENMAAAIAMINGADTADELTAQITGTNSAVEQADIIMGSFSEKMARKKARWDDLKISIFNATESIQPFISGSLDTIGAVGELLFNVNILQSTFSSLRTAVNRENLALTKNTLINWNNAAVTKINTILTKANTRAKNKNLFATQRLAWSNKMISFGMLAGAIASHIQAKGINSVAMSFGKATLGATAFSIALNALGIGLILTAIAGLVYGLKHLWQNSRKFREILFGIGYVGKAVFHNIGVFIKRLWNLIIKPIGSFVWNYYKFIFVSIWNVVKKVVQGIGDFFMWLWNSVIKPIGSWIGETMVSVFQSIINNVSIAFNFILNFVSSVWNWVKETFGSFGKWVEDTLITPIYDAFSKVWKWLTKLLDEIINKLSTVFAPIKALWNKLFSSDGMKDIKVEWEAGKKAGGESFDKDQQKETQKVEIVENQFDLKKGIPDTPTLGGSAVKSVNNNKSVGGSSSENGNKVRNLNIGKMMENFNVHMNTTNGIDKTQLLNAVREVLLTATADFAGAN